MHLRTLLLTVTFVPVLLFGQQPLAQPGLQLKSRIIATDGDAPQMQVALPAVGTVHQILQFNTPPTSDTVNALAAQGIMVVGAVPVNGLLVTMDAARMQAFAGQAAADVSSTLSDTLMSLGVRYVAPVDPSDKISPAISQAAVSLPTGSLPFNGNFIVEFHGDVTADEIRSLILNQGIMLVEHPDLSTNHLMIRFTSADQMAAGLVTLTDDDRVAYIFPASDDLANGISTRAYAAAATVGGPIGQLIATNGYGWDGAGQNATTLSYFFSQMTAKMPAGQPQSEILRAMAEWSKVIKLTWKPGTSATAARTVNILFASGPHGDGFPFDGPGGVLAHTFYPAPPNPEPIAGDMHLDNDENWHAGVNTDLFSVSLHELGHALGLGHSDNPADVMYPYYKIVTTLAAGDKAAILTMYAAQDGTPSTPVNNGGGTPPATGPTPVAPLTLTVQTPQAPGTAATVALSGTVSGGTGSIAVNWSANGASGVAQVSGANWTASNIPLTTGANSITVTASNSSKTVSQTVTVTRQAAGLPTGVKDTTAPAITIAAPMSTTVTTPLATFTMSGTASDNVAVASVTWVTSTGNSGTAQGTSNWSAQIPVLKGFTQVTVRATDPSGNTSWRSVLITRY
jgi:hypothetical protein